MVPLDVAHAAVRVAENSEAPVLVQDGEEGTATLP